MSELKKCPFCSGESIVVKTAKCGRYIACCDCGCRTEEFETDYAGSARDKAVAAWNRRTQPENEPLTLDELRGMDGEPVWIVTIDDPQNNPPAWEIIYEVSTHGVYMRRGDNPDDFGAFEYYGKTWLAYRRKPERSEG